jgi:glucoamylase
LSDHVEDWTVAKRGELVPGKPRYYIRINPADPDQPAQYSDPDSSIIRISNGGGEHPARNVVSGDFLELVRLGVRGAQDPLILDSIAVIDQVLKCDLPQGPSWRRYNHDGYGQKDDGSPFDGIGTGRCWPLLSGERGHYELAAGRDPRPFIRAMENFANEGAMLPEQVWDEDDLPEARMFRGRPTGAAMPLCWAHAEYLTLVRSAQDGVGFDCLEPVYERYAQKRTKGKVEIWTLAHQLQRMGPGKQLRIITSAAATVHWSCDGWQTAKDESARESLLGCWFADLATTNLAPETRVRFTLRWEDHWEGRDFEIVIR